MAPNHMLIKATVWLCVVRGSMGMCGAGPISIVSQKTSAASAENMSVKTIEGFGVPETKAKHLSSQRLRVDLLSQTCQHLFSDGMECQPTAQIRHICMETFAPGSVLRLGAVILRTVAFCHYIILSVWPHLYTFACSTYYPIPSSFATWCRLSFRKQCSTLVFMVAN